MAKRILVPLDRTEEAEIVLPLVVDAARGGGATIRLLHVAPIPDNVVNEEGHVVAYADQEVTRLEAEGLEYLRGLGLRVDGLAIEYVVRFGNPVDEILVEAAAFGADLIALHSGCKRSFSRFLLGSTAEQVCRKTRIPVMILHPGGDGRS